MYGGWIIEENKGGLKNGRKKSLVRKGILDLKSYIPGKPIEKLKENLV